MNYKLMNMKKLLILDNYDSFTYNLVHLIEEIGGIEFEVHRNDQIKLEEVQRFDKILLSPGPGIPEEAGILKELIQQYAVEKSILGICLGVQAIGEVFGAKLENMETVYHGIATPVHLLEKNALFTNCPGTFQIGRYHSWVVSRDNLPSDLIKYDVAGLQFHPESILSEYGRQIIENWLTN
jgi:anthranilate synthase component 2